jgi:hypothetical protein
VISGLRYANFLWWINRVQSDELEANSKSRSWYEVGKLNFSLSRKVEGISNPSPHLFFDGCRIQGLNIRLVCNVVERGLLLENFSLVTPACFFLVDQESRWEFFCLSRQHIYATIYILSQPNKPTNQLIIGQIILIIIITIILIAEDNK